MSESIVLGGGCFWCTESVFKNLRGVVSVVPGYAGGHVDNPSYEQVCGKQTGHIEVVKVEFDPEVLDLRTLLQVFFATHDPTTPDRQGADVGPQYASAVFCGSDSQKAVVRDTIDQVQAELGEAVVTKVLDAGPFWQAEAYHHDYYARNPYQGYCQAVISPKLAKFRKQYAELLRT
ncbi:peptide-methionine (S)-S-oxide reductase [Allopusillimonas soli]|uniref:Peptide methionine sulfoxide reductase MsrA n=1 Tax=Allopusillimonas soli TaxID=659016 RepID=A0A853FIF3_9BURK|nr:peptide-methionine (S)-S-oxide reductase MsrA [Allopusillimonas soli]NYT37756.1 peptide-methionine (S)-S-oxide reductase MsrA [Allopusillimonas soli]TEA74305.1 peptide-methionine (S)-S-oxide reductase [Allopusillimonas soli]